MMRRDLMGGRIRRRDNKPRLPRFENVRSKSAVARFKPGICYRLETKCLPPVIHGMFGIAYIKVDVVNRFNLEEVRFLGHGTGHSVRCGSGYSRSHSASFD